MVGRVQGKIALVTGAGRGQGRSHAVRLAEEGADIIAIDICKNIEGVDYDLASEDDLAETARLVTELGRRAHIAIADVRVYSEIESAVQQGISEIGAPDIVSANAGVTSFHSTTELPEDAWDAVIDSNLKGVWHTCKAVVPSMISAGKGGSIIMTSSMGGLRGIQNLPHYTAAKTGLLGLMRTLAQELAPHNIRVNTIHPTTVDTPMVHNDALYELFQADPKLRNREGIEGPMSKFNMLDIAWIEPRDVSNLLLFLGSDEARYITAAHIPVDAGCAELNVG
ncbi:3-ketoacyl-ACP reductase [Rhodococcus rhodochrous]|nr:3-ketoacyl-ACP reductase [Rhodococcus rhodochrous]